MSQGKKTQDPFFSLINEKIKKGNKKTVDLYSSPHIYRVPKNLRMLNEDAYTPRLIAIGPLHRRDEHLQTHMQDVKMQYTRSLIRRTAEGTGDIGKTMGNTLKNCVEKMKECVEEARKYYPEEVPVVDKAKKADEEKKANEEMAKTAGEEKKANEEMAKKAEEEKAKKAEEEMVEMMLVDGCFILELLYSSYHKEPGDGDNSKSIHGGEDDSQSSSNVTFVDPIQGSLLTESIVTQDLLLLENQIPFFVLEHLFDLTVEKIPDGAKQKKGKENPDGPIKGSKPSLTDYVLHYFGDIMGLYDDSSEDENSKKDNNGDENGKNCVILWINKMDSCCFTKQTESGEKVSGKRDQKYHHILHFLHDHYSQGVKHPTAVRPTSPVGEPARENRAFISERRRTEVGNKNGKEKGPSKYPRKFTELEILATDLDYAGVKFVPRKVKNLFDVKFEPPKPPFWLFRRARFEIPILNIHDPTEPFLRNLIAMEQCCPGVPRYFTSYAKFFDMLINSKEDVKELMKAKVISNQLGANEDISDLFNKLCKQIVMPGDFIFNDQCQRAYKYSQLRWPKSLAHVRRKYFDAPWSFIAFCVAIIGFGITITNFIRGFLK